MVGLDELAQKKAGNKQMWKAQRDVLKAENRSHHQMDRVTCPLAEAMVEKRKQKVFYQALSTDMSTSGKY